MKWGRVIIILLDPKDAVCQYHALAWQIRYSVPNHLCFEGFSEEGDSELGFQKLHSKRLMHLSDTKTKIIIVGHGSSFAIAGAGNTNYYPEGLARALKAWGVDMVGLLAFKSCNLGRGAFLDDLKSWLGREGILCGWLIGYRHPVLAMRMSSHEYTDSLDHAIRRITFGIGKRSDDHRVKIVKGNLDVAPPNGRSSRYSVS
jgi:hypothetical protein